MRAREKLDPGTVEAMERLLTARHAELADQVRSARRGVPMNGDGLSHELTARASATLQEEIEAALLDRRSRQLLETEAALERLGRGEYGFCLDCEAFIGLVRLRALPFARRCGPCQHRAEAPVRRAAGKVLAANAPARRSG